MERRAIGKQVYLRPITLEDCTDRYVAWLTDPDINRFLETRWQKTSMEGIRDFVEQMTRSPDNFLFAICTVDTDTHVGNIKLGPVNRNHSFADVSYFIGAKEYWGRGIATEAISLVVQFGFDRLGLHRVQAGVYSTNVGSRKALERNGFLLEGVCREKFIDGSQRVDHLLLGLINDTL